MWGVVGITVAFVILAVVLLWVLITSRTHILIKIFLISFVLWYGAVLYYTPDNLMGWGKTIPDKNHLPDKAWVQSVLIKEPAKKLKEPGYIYFLIVSFQEKNKTNLTLDPRNTFTYKGDREPRLYKVDYSKELHKEILKAQKKRKKGGYGYMILMDKKKKEKDDQFGDSNESEMRFKVLNPASLIEKEVQ